MLMPKRVKRRKQFRGSMKGKALRGNKITNGEYGIVAMEPCWIRSNQIEAARIANVDSFVQHLDNGYDTVLTDDGAGLSNGQRQLIAIARAALANAPVLILDEATSSIDSRTEKMVQEGMDRLMEGRTVFVIAHRLSTIVNSDVIMVMDHGRIIERGDHDSLMEQGGTYYRLYTGGLEID